MARKPKQPAPRSIRIEIDEASWIYHLDRQDNEDDLDDIVWEEVRSRVSYSWKYE